MRLLGRILGISFALLLAVLVGAYFFLQDANRLKPELAALVEENTEYTVRFKGDINWQLFPPLKLRMQEVVLSGPEQTVEAADLDLKMDLSAMWEDINQWRITELNLRDTTITQEDTRTHLKQLDVLDFRPGQPAAFFADAVYTSDAETEPFAAVLDGTVTFFPATDTRTQRIVLSDTQVDTALASGVCSADISEVKNPPVNLPTAKDEDLLPIDTLLTYDLTADCDLSALTLGSETFQDASVKLTNVAGQVNVLLDVKDFLGGSLLTDVDIDVTQTPAEWVVLPEIDNVDSQRLLNWADQRLQWIAPVAFNSSVKLRGNTIDELANSVNAASEFDGGQGQINIVKIKQQLMQIAALARQTDEVAAWPDVWEYQEFTGRWNIDGPAHDLKFAIDNMSVDANGAYDFAADSIDMLANVTVSAPPEGSPFKVNPLLEGTPIPIRCAGPAADPTCQLDKNATQNLIARALQSDDESGLRGKLEQKIEEEVPEEYQEAARGLLDLLGRALEKED